MKRRSSSASAQGLGILPFRGYGDARHLSCRGRVLEERGIVRVRDRDTFYDNLHKMYRRFTGRPANGALVRARAGEAEVTARTSKEGFFQVELPRDGDDGPEIDVHLELVEPTPREPVRATAHVFVVPPGAELGVISDIDDTILRTYATDPFRMTRVVLFGNAQNRLPFSGVRAFYQALHRGRDKAALNPFFYVSSSAWHIYDVMHDFMEIHELPRGPILLRDIELSRRSLFASERHDHKLDRIEEILAATGGLPFLLIGDSGQRDAELYREIVERHAGRILAVYLRDVLPTPRRREHIEEIARSIEECGCDFLLVDTTLEAAQHAVERGFFSADEIEEIERDEIEDEPKSAVGTFVTHTGRLLARWTRPRRLRRRARQP